MPPKRSRFDGALDTVAALLVAICKSATEFLFYPDPSPDAEGGPVASSKLHRKSLQKHFKVLTAIQKLAPNMAFQPQQAKGHLLLYYLGPQCGME